MNSLMLPFNANKASVEQPSLFFDSKINTATNTTGNGHKSPATTKILKDHPDQFAYALAHEVRNPLANINLSIEMLKSAINDNDLNTYLDIIMRSSIRINNLINELPKYQDADEVQSEKYSVQQLLDEVLEMSQDQITLKGITVSKEYALQDCNILLNKPKMTIALTNIIINAIDSITSEKGELKLVTKSNDDKYCIQIEDNGCGISERDLKHIFKPYFTNKPGRLGLGLATTNDILQSNHVEVNVESKLGKGTRFILLLGCF